AGHTATVLTVSEGKEVLVFGGAAAGVPVAEVLAAGQTFVPLTSYTGPPRRDHATVTLPPGDRALVIGGRNDTAVLGATALYQGRQRSLEAGSITLKVPR